MNQLALFKLSRTLETRKDLGVALTTLGVTEPNEGDSMSDFSTQIHSNRYKSHLNSNKWKMLKTQYWWSERPNSCWACGKEASRDYTGFNFHHRNYQNLCNETLNDVVLLCREHHFDLEQWLKELKQFGETVESWTPKYIKMTRDAFNLSIKPIARWI